MSNVLLADGSYINGAKIDNCCYWVSEVRSKPAQLLQSTIVMGADYFDTKEAREMSRRSTHRDWAELPY